MKTVPELAKEIEQFPESMNQLLDSFRTTDNDLRMFLYSLKQVPAPIVPALLITFYREQERTIKKTVLDVVKNNSVGLLFEVIKLNETYQFTGFDKDQCPTFCKIGDSTQVYLDMEMGIKWLF
jgi:hypothetical protein